MSSATIIPNFATSVTSKATWIDRLARRAVFRALRRLEVGQLTLIESDARHNFGRCDDTSGYEALVRVHQPRFFRAIAFGGALGAGEAYIQGHWSTNDLTALIRLLIVNEQAFSSLDGRWAKLAAPARRVFHALRRNTVTGAKKNIVAHYDLSNEFYAYFLDPTMTYSAGIFEHPGASLRDASIAKLDRICRKLQLQPSDHVLEIGTGWGSFALYAARNYGCRVTTTTISDEQYVLAKARIVAAGLEDRITLLSEDYRNLHGQFDKLVSIEMIEAVGHQYYNTFFDRCAKLLKPSGAALIQAIIMADRYYEHAKQDVDFIKRYIFPGSCIPSLGALTNASAATDLQLWQLEDITPHYATTLRAWHDRFHANLHEIRALGYSDAFIRMWEYYLCYCEAGFRERTIGCTQLMFAKPRCELSTELPRPVAAPEYSIN